MFLAVHNEQNELQSFDLDGILQKGDAVYTSVKRALQSKGKLVGNFLNFDELPNTIETTFSLLQHPKTSPEVWISQRYTCSRKL